MLIAFHPDTYRETSSSRPIKRRNHRSVYGASRPAARKSYDEFIDSTAQDAAAAGRRSRRDRVEDAGAPYYSQKTKPKGFKKLKLALGVLGIIFVVLSSSYS
jgi:hypothetical protein